MKKPAVSDDPARLLAEIEVEIVLAKRVQAGTLSPPSFVSEAMEYGTEEEVVMACRRWAQEVLDIKERMEASSPDGTVEGRLRLVTH